MQSYTTFKKIEDPLCQIPTYNQTAAIIHKKNTLKNHETSVEEEKDSLESNQERNEDKPILENEHQQTVDSEDIDTGYQLRPFKRLTNRIKS